MRRWSLILICIILSSNFLYAQVGFPSYHAETDLLLASPGALKFGLYGYDNPALLNYLHQFDLQFAWSDANGKWSDFNRWGVFAAVPHFSFGFIREKSSVGSITDYRISVGWGKKSFSYGIGYGWTGGDKEQFSRSNLFKIATLIRPVPYLSIGVTGSIATAVDVKEGVVDVAVRPFGNERVTLFTDYAVRSGQTLSDGHWSAGLAIEPLSGIRIAGRFFDSKAFSIGLEFSLGAAGLSTQAHYDRGGTHSYNTYGIRLGAYDRNIFRTELARRDRYVSLNLLGPVKYQRSRFFDDTNTLRGLLEVIDAAKLDPSVAGIAVNASGMEANREILWELREKLKEFRNAGKRVVIFIDRPGITEYHFASVADRIVLDPTGIILLPGVVSGRTFLKGTLEKLGVGFDEWRFYTYKSANEVFSREAMSDADREQRQKLVDDYYRLIKADISRDRNVAEEKYDSLINDDFLFLPDAAIKENLVDTLGRWDEVLQVITDLEGERKTLVSPGSLAAFQLPPDSYWGERPRIALIYALGVCAMDEGINARRLVKDVERAVKDPAIRAIVLRVDSPGGDGMASDYIAEALKKAKGKKPVIVSQGLVAASGGYWLSMYADTIVAAPNTITGSIGVIGGWFYNKGLKESLGMSTDRVQAGTHADFGFGFVLPLIRAGIPDRNLSHEERSRAESAIRSYYNSFLSKVADGRKRQIDDIEPIAQGRIWSGSDAKQNGLVDVLGGLGTAIAIARQRAGIPSDQQTILVEFPERRLFEFLVSPSRLFASQERFDDIHNPVEHIRFLLKHNGQPLPILPLDFMEYHSYDF